MNKLYIEPAVVRQNRSIVRLGFDKSFVDPARFGTKFYIHKKTPVYFVVTVWTDAAK